MRRSPPFEDRCICGIGKLTEGILRDSGNKKVLPFMGEGTVSPALKGSREKILEKLRKLLK